MSGRGEIKELRAHQALLVRKGFSSSRSKLIYCESSKAKYSFSKTGNKHLMISNLRDSCWGTYWRSPLPWSFFEISIEAIYI